MPAWEAIISTALLQKMRARVTRDGTKCAKISTFNGYDIYFRGTQRQFSENICWEDDLRSRIFVVNFLLACLSKDFRTSKKWYNCPIFNGCFPVKGHLEFSGAFLLTEIFEKVSFDLYNFRISRRSARKSEQMKNF